MNISKKVSALAALVLAGSLIFTGWGKAEEAPAPAAPPAPAYRVPGVAQLSIKRFSDCVSIVVNRVQAIPRSCPARLPRPGWLL